MARSPLADIIADSLQRTDTKHGRMLHLDGLRACALLGVLAFHFGGLLRGGFLGVDVFFVLSGFLMTRALWDRALRGAFSLPAFLAARVLRICPALLAALLAATVAARACLPPPDLPAAVRSAASAAMFVSNHQFYAENGYHDAESTAKPLLHTWSLGVEGQFYLLWSLVALLGRVDAAAVAMFAMCALSVAVHFASMGDSSAVFFLMPNRLYQFCAGSLAVLLYDVASPKTSNTISAASLAVVLGSFAFVRATHSPISVFSLPIVVASASIIATPKAVLAGERYLSHPFLRYLGNVSYSAYLVHWPAIVLSLATFHSVAKAYAVAWVVTCVGTPVLYYGIEESFRATKERKSRICGLVFCLMLFVVIQLARFGYTAVDLYDVVVSDGTGGEVTGTDTNSTSSPFVHISGNSGKTTRPAFELLGRQQYALSFYPYARKLISQKRLNVKGSSSPYTLLLGDSYSRNGLATISRVTLEKTGSTKPRLWHIWTSGCAPFADGHILLPERSIDDSPTITSCSVCSSNVTELFSEGKPYSVVLGLRWEDYVHSDETLASVSGQLALLQQVSPRLILLGPPPKSSYDVVKCLWKLGGVYGTDEAKVLCPAVFEAAEEYFKTEDRIRKLLEMNPGVKYVNASRTELCSETSAGSLECKAWTEKSGPYYYDDFGHLTLAGGTLLYSGLSQHFTLP